MPAKMDLQNLKHPELRGHFPCGMCEKVFGHAASLNKHLRKNHKAQGTCLLCNTAPREQEDLHEHIRNAHNLLKIFTCFCCNYSFSNKKFLAEHMKNLRETGQLGSVPIIAKSNNAPGAFLMSHYSRTSSENRGGSMSPSNSTTSSTPSMSSLDPPQANKGEQSLGELINKDISKILASRDLQGNFSCRACGLVFLHDTSLNRHRRRKHSDYTCLLCNTVLGASQDLNEHMKVYHDLPMIVTCGCCNYAFGHKKFHAEHMKSVRETGQLGSAPIIAKSNNAPGAFLLDQRAQPKFREGSLSSAQTSPVSTPSIRSGSSSKRVSPEPVKNEMIAETCDELINDAISKILASGIVYGNSLTLPNTWERIYNLGREMVIEELEKKTDSQ